MIFTEGLHLGKWNIIVIVTIIIISLCFGVISRKKVFITKVQVGADILSLKIDIT
jgi:hypothetical protein